MALRASDKLIELNTLYEIESIGNGNTFPTLRATVEAFGGGTIDLYGTDEDETIPASLADLKLPLENQNISRIPFDNFPRYIVVDVNTGTVDKVLATNLIATRKSDIGVII